MSFTESLDELVAADRSGLLGIAPGWIRVRLGDVCSILNGYPFSSQRFASQGGTPLIRIRDVLRGSTETHYVGEFDAAYLVRHGDLLVGMDGDFNCAAWAGSDALLNQRVCKLVPDEARYSRRLLLLALPGYLAAINRKTSSITVKHLSSRTVQEIPLPLPPRLEQDQIADAIESHFSRLDAATATLERVQRNLERYRASVLKAAVEGRLVPTEAELAKKEGRSYEPASVLLKRILAERRRRWEEAELAKLKAKGKPPTDDRWKAKYEEPAAPDTDGLPELPEGWCWTTLEQIASETLIGLVRSQAEQSPSAPFSYVKMDQIDMEGRLDLAESRSTRVAATPEEAERYALRDGDILFNTRNSAELVGKSALVRNPQPSTLFNNNIMRIRVSSGMAAVFLAHFMLSQVFRNQIAKVKKATTSIAAVYGRDLFPCAIAIPPLKEQERIAREADRLLVEVRHSRDAVRLGRARVRRLRQSILKWAFEGRLVGAHSSPVQSGGNGST